VTTDRRRLIEDALGRSPRTIREIDVGYDFEVAIVDDDWVFRFPRRGGVEEVLELEIALLPVIAPALPVASTRSMRSTRPGFPWSITTGSTPTVSKR